MKAPLFILLLLAPALAFAQSAEPAPVQDATSAQVVEGETRDGDAQAQEDAYRDCMRYTGSRVVSSRTQRRARADAAEKVGELDRDGCVAANGRVYSREDLRRTGQTDIADALRMLDPAIR